MKSSWTRAILLVLAASAGCTWTASTLQETIIPKAATEAPAVARFVGAFPREASAAGASATLPTLRELEAMLKRAHERDGGVGRNLISNGRPTGGSKYPFLVSMWLGTSNDVRNTTLLTPNLCHGVMVTDDVFVTHRACAAVLSVFPIVMIGDYDSSRPLDESVQLREVSFAAVSVEHVVTGQGDGGAILGPSNLAVGLLREPVTLPGFTAAVMNDDAEQPVPFQNVTVVGYGADATPVGQNLTEWPGPALEATMTATSQATCSVLSRLYDVAMYADSAYLCAQPAGPDEAAVPCEDDMGGPVLDSDKNLLGITYLTKCGFAVPAAVFLKASYFRLDVQAVACQLSPSDILPFPCPDFACPVDTVQPGYPWAELVDVRPYTRARNGFDPVDVSQFPPPGSILRFNTTTEVTVTATDASNRSLSCTTRVVAPPLEPCGSVEMNLTEAGTYPQSGKFQPNRAIVTGTVFKMKGILQDKLTGKGSVTARLRKGSDKYTGSIEFKGNRTKGALNNLLINSPFSFINASDSLEVDLEVRNNSNTAKNVARYVVYCQKVFAGYNS